MDFYSPLKCYYSKKNSEFNGKDTNKNSLALYRIISISKRFFTNKTEAFDLSLQYMVNSKIFTQIMDYDCLESLELDKNLNSDFELSHVNRFSLPSCNSLKVNSNQALSFGLKHFLSRFTHRIDFLKIKKTTKE